MRSMEESSFFSPSNRYLREPRKYCFFISFSPPSRNRMPRATVETPPGFFVARNGVTEPPLVAESCAGCALRTVRKTAADDILFEEGLVIVAQLPTTPASGATHSQPSLQLLGASHPLKQLWAMLQEKFAGRIPNGKLDAELVCPRGFSVLVAVVSWVQRSVAKRGAPLHAMLPWLRIDAVCRSPLEARPFVEIAVLAHRVLPASIKDHVTAGALAAAQFIGTQDELLSEGARQCRDRHYLWGLANDDSIVGIGTFSSRIAGVPIEDAANCRMMLVESAENDAELRVRCVAVVALEPEEELKALGRPLLTSVQGAGAPPATRVAEVANAQSTIARFLQKVRCGDPNAIAQLATRAGSAL